MRRLFVLGALTAIALSTPVLAQYLDPNYVQEVAATHDADLRDIAACAADPARPTAAYVISNDDRHVHQLYWDGTVWQWRLVVGLGGARPGALACGDAWLVNGTTPELWVAHGTVLRMVAWDGSQWVTRAVYTASSSLGQNKPAAGDIDPRLAGPEVYFTHQALKQAWWDGAAWRISALPGNPRYTAIGDADPDVAGVELYTSQTGALKQVRYSEGWVTTTIAAIGGAGEQNDLEVADADGDGQADVVANWHRTNASARLWVVRKPGSSWVTELVFQAGTGTADAVHHFHGIEVGEFDASHSGPEVLLTWSPLTHNPGRFSIFGKVGEAWTSRLIWEDLDEMHGLVLSDVDPRYAGLEAVLVGHPSQIFVIRPASQEP